jgi:hypothetical protein
VHEEATAKRKMRRHLEDRHWKALLLGLLEKENTYVQHLVNMWQVQIAKIKNAKHFTLTPGEHCLKCGTKRRLG